MGYVLWLGELKPLIEDLSMLGFNITVGASDGARRFSDERDYTPFYWWLRTLNLPPPKRPISSAVLAQEGQDSGA